MKITLHVGAEHTNTQRLIAAMNTCRRSLAQRGILAPKVSVYQKRIKTLLQTLDGLPPIEVEEDAILESILKERTPDHLILIDDKWSGPAGGKYQNGQFQDNLATNVRSILELFSRHEVRLSMSLRNPAYILNTDYASDKPPHSLEWLLKQHDPLQLRWRSCIESLREAHPDVPLLLWCEEDAPFIWPQILRAVVDIPPGANIRAQHLATADALEPSAVGTFRKFLDTNKPKTPRQFELIAQAFVRRHGRKDPFPAALPDWDKDMLKFMSGRYAQDVVHLSRLDGIDFILPET